MADMDGIDVLRGVDVDGWDRWLAEHGAERRAVWVAIAKKGSGVEGLTPSQALDVALCHGWIDSTRKALDAAHFLQRYSPRRPGSAWSQVNVERVAELDAAGRMRLAGLVQVDAAKADGRWADAYERQRTATLPDDLAAVLSGNDRARAAYQALTRSEQYAAFLPLLKAGTGPRRAAALRRAVTMLEGARPLSATEETRAATEETLAATEETSGTDGPAGR